MFNINGLVLRFGFWYFGLGFYGWVRVMVNFRFRVRV